MTLRATSHRLVQFTEFPVNIGRCGIPSGLVHERELDRSGGGCPAI